MPKFSGDRLRELRKAAGLTREVLAVSIGRTLCSVASWEQSKKVPDGESVARLCAALDCSTTDLFTSDGPVRTPTMAAAR